MAEGFMDGATITSALTYLNLGRNATRPLWHQKSVLEATYLMLHDNIHIIPRPRGTGSEHGDYAIVASEFRELIVDSHRRKEVLRSTFKHAEDNYSLVKSAWEQSLNDNDFQSWADVQRHDRWKNQTLTYQGLFDFESSPMIAKVTGYDLSTVQRIHTESIDPVNVQKWIRSIESSEAQIANAAWVIGGFTRGFFYDNLAAAEGLQLLKHPFRSCAQHPLDALEHHEVTNSEELLVKILIANALTESTKQRRVKTWATTLKKARDYINTAQPDLRNKTQPEAEESALLVARKLDLQGGPRYFRGLIDIGLFAGISLTGFSLAPWIGPLGIPAIGLATRAVTLGYKHLMNKSPGEQIGDALLRSNYQFRWLARSIPGRIERGISSLAKNKLTTSD